MGVYVPKAELPKTCGECKMFEAAGCYLFRDIKFTKERHPDCPLVEVRTPHGRLIDVDALGLHIADWQLSLPALDMTEADRTIYGTLDGVFDVIADADTVIEAEG